MTPNYQLQPLLRTIIDKLTVKFDEHLAEQYAWWLLEAATGKDKLFLVTNPTFALTKASVVHLEYLIDRIITQDMPLAYAIGHVTFAGCTIEVKPPILIPRPETEQWCLELIEQLKHYPSHTFNILDLCTGSGCIAIAIAKAFPRAYITAVDISPQAIVLAQENARLNNVFNISFVQSDLFTALPAAMTFDCIVSNPPYISPKEWQTLDLSVKNWEDPNALIAEHEGLALIEKIITQAPTYLKKTTSVQPQVVIEIGYNQGARVKQLMINAGYHHVTIRKDDNNHDRVAWGTIYGDTQ